MILLATRKWNESKNYFRNTIQMIYNRNIDFTIKFAVIAIFAISNHIAQIMQHHFMGL